jgi:hypothetical protein
MGYDTFILVLIILFVSDLPLFEIKINGSYITSFVAHLIDSELRINKRSYVFEIVSYFNYFERMNTIKNKKLMNFIND